MIGWQRRKTETDDHHEVDDAAEEARLDDEFAASMAEEARESLVPLPTEDEARTEELDAANAAVWPEPPEVSSPVASRRLDELVAYSSETDEQVAAIADQLREIVNDNYDFTVSAPGSEGNLHIQKLTVLINSLLENVRRNISDLSTLAADLDNKVRERTLQLDLVIKGSNDGVWIWDVPSGRAEFSSRWQQLLGLEPDTLNTIEGWLARVHPDDALRMRSALRTHLQGASTYLHEDYRIRTADGTYRWMWCRGKCHRDETGRAILMAGTQTDVHRLRTIDPSTGLPHARALMTRIEEMIAREIPFRVMVIGLPRIFLVKEDLATDDIEKLRAAIAERLSAGLPFGADLARISGDFYVTVVPCNLSPTCDVKLVADGVTNAFREPIAISGRKIVIEPCIGSTMLVRGGGVSPSDVMRDAWISYRCARTGNMRANLLTEDQLREARERAEMEQEVRAALENGWFIPYFQPIVDISTGQIRGFETLVRMNHPDKGLITPGAFVPVAESMGVMGEISMLMLDQALDLLADWADEAGPRSQLYLSVNLDASQVLAENFAVDLLRQMRSRDVDPGKLKIEIVESSVVGSFAVATRQLSLLRDMGIAIALDDFGTGYSSLEYLSELEFDLIKIDKSFVDGIETDEKKQSMMRLMCIMSEMLGADVCVEGVETEAQVNIARQFEASLAQGYYYARPLSREDAIAFAAKARAQD